MVVPHHAITCKVREAVGGSHNLSVFVDGQPASTTFSFVAPLPFIYQVSYVPGVDGQQTCFYGSLFFGKLIFILSLG